jgi:hypothetical protein
MAKLNCWEYKKCGREPGGLKEKELGVCPATTDIRLDGVHSGKNSGRTCWVVAGTLCEGKVQGSFAKKETACTLCDFYKTVLMEEKNDFLMARELLDKLHTYKEQV